MSQPLNVYAYFDGGGRRHYADQDDVSFVGTWSTTGTFLASLMQVVDYTNGQYIAITDSINKNPQTPPSRYDPVRYWSPFVLVLAGTGTNSNITPQDAYALAEAAYELAVIGTEVGSAAYSLAEDAYEIAVEGTQIGSAAYEIAQAASTAASEALALAQEGTLSHNYVAWAGTMELDMTGDSFQSVYLNGDTQILLLNFEAPVPQAKSITARLINNVGTLVSVEFDPEIVWFGQGAPTTVPVDTLLMVNFTSLGTELTDVSAAFTQST